MFSLEFLAAIRSAELDEIEAAIPSGARVLELGGGTGQQALMLEARGYDIVSVDVESSMYREEQVFPVVVYDGYKLPFADSVFDVVMSSNVLEHVENLAALHREITRVLRPDGMGIHVMPTHAWSFWTIVTHYPALAARVLGSLPSLLPRSFSIYGLSAPLRGAIGIVRMLVGGVLPPRHGERGNVLSEILYFRPGWWRREFESQGYCVVDDYPMDLFYTGYMVLGPKLSISSRRKLRKVLGSACHLYKVRPPGKEHVNNLWKSGG